MHTIAQLMQVFDCNLETGVITWKITRNHNAVKGQIAGGWDKDGYNILNYEGKCYKAHRVIWAIATGSWPLADIDHRDRNKSNNAFSNLRLGGKSENGQNLDIRANNKSGFTGVWLYKPTGRWCAQITIDYVCHNLGYFDTPEEASEAYKAAKRQLHTFNPILSS